MPNKYIFADEAGCFTFNRNPNVSRYFILCTIIMDECPVATDLFELRRRLAWEGFELGETISMPALIGKLCEMKFSRLSPSDRSPSRRPSWRSPRQCPMSEVQSRDFTNMAISTTSNMAHRSNCPRTQKHSSQRLASVLARNEPHLKARSMT